MALAIFAISLVMYLLTLAPSLGSYESSSWIVNSMFSGLPSSPGNLLYLIAASAMANLYEWLVAPVLIGVARLSDALGFIFRPSLEPAVGINLISALSVAGAAGLSFSLLDRLLTSLRGDRGWPDAAGRWILALGTLFIYTIPVVWSAAVTAGPYGFNLLLVVFACWMMVRGEENPSSAGTRMLLLAFIAGASFSHNQVFLLFCVMLGVFAWGGKNVWSALKANLGPALVLFLVGCTTYLYAWVRPQAVPGLGDPVEMFTSGFWRYLFNIPGMESALPRQGNFFTVQIPLMIGRLEAQADHWIAGIILLLLFHFGMFYHIKQRSGSGRGVLLALAVSFLAGIWIYNPGVTNLTGFDRHLLIFIMIMAGWVLTGITVLYLQAIEMARRFQARMEFTGRRFERLVTLSSTVLLIAAMLSPMYFRWRESDMSSYYLIRDLGGNQLRGVEQNGILILGSAAEYYRALYAEKVLFQDSQRTLINYPGMTSTHYIRQLKTIEPPAPMDLSDAQIGDMRPVRLEKTESFTAGKLSVSYPAETVFLVPDMVLMSVLRANKFERPVYFSSNIAPQNMLGLAGYCAIRGLTVRLFEENPLTSADSSNYWRGRYPIAIDIPWTQQLLWGYYVHHTTLWQARGDEHNARFRPLLIYARAHANLAEAFLGQKNGDAAASNYRQCEFFDPDYESKLLNFASRLAQQGQYEQTKDFADMYFTHIPPDPLKWAGLAKLALANQDSLAATELLVKSLEADPDFLLGYQKLIRLFSSMEKHTMVSAFISRWLVRHPDDMETRQLWEEYNATKALPPDFPD